MLFKEGALLRRTFVFLNEMICESINIETSEGCVVYRKGRET